jgi:G3E family GTPase
VNKVNVHVSDSIKHVYLTFGKESEFNYDGLNQLVAELLWEEKENVKIMRMKGIFKTTCSTNIYSLQAVEDTFELVDGGVEWNNTL